jgi:hypothetical protein
MLATDFLMYGGIGRWCSRWGWTVCRGNRVVYFFSYIPDCSQDAEYVEEAFVVIVALYGAAAVAFG